MLVLPVKTYSLAIHALYNSHVLAKQSVGKAFHFLQKHLD